MSQDSSNQESLNDQLIVRREKMQELRDKGVNPFADRYERTHMSVEVHDQFDEKTTEEIAEEISEEIVTEISTEDMELVIPFENTELSEETTEENN